MLDTPPNRATRRKIGWRTPVGQYQSRTFVPRFIRRHHEHPQCAAKVRNIASKYALS